MFAGSASRTKPFFFANGGVNYAGNQGQRALLVAPEFQVSVGDSGSNVFLAISNGNGVFATAPGGTNSGAGVVGPGSVTDLPAWVPDTYTITLTGPASYEVRDGAAALVTSGSFVSGESIAFNGIQVSITGQPAVGDTFSVQPSVNQDLFTTLQNLITALQTSSSGAPAQAKLQNILNRSLVDLDQAQENILETRARVGARLNAIDSEKGVQEGFDIHLQQVISTIQDVDFAEVVSRLAQQAGTLEAAQASFVRIQGLSLFNFL